MKRLAWAVALAAASASAPLAEAPQGHLLLNGGGGESASYWQKFLELAGGAQAPIVILPTASERPEAGPEYVADLEKLGATEVRWLPLRNAEDAAEAEHVAALARARGIFFTGGDQSRITAALLGSPSLAAIREVYERGGVIGGTSAGTACMSRRMITGDGDFTLLTARNVVVKEGLGLWPRGLLDQHFVRRQRQNRLIAAVLEQPEEMGFGVDERTTLWLKPSGEVEVIGEGWVMVVDARGAAPRRTTGAFGEQLGARDLVIHLLLPGDRFDLASGRPLTAPVP